MFIYLYCLAFPWFFSVKIWGKYLVRSKAVQVLFPMNILNIKILHTLLHVMSLCPPDVWWLGAKRRKVPQQAGPPTPSTPALHRLLLLLLRTRSLQRLLTKCGYGLFPCPQRWQQLHPHCQKVTQPFPWVWLSVSVTEGNNLAAKCKATNKMFRTKAWHINQIRVSTGVHAFVCPSVLHLAKH